MKKAKSIIIAAVLIALVIGYYFYLSNRQKEHEETVVTAVQTVINRSLENNYPPTPKEVIRYYSEITKCLYNEQYSDEEFEKMADKLMGLYDDELLEQNPRDNYLLDLKSDVKDLINNGYSIVNYTVSSSTDVEFDTVDGRECAKLYCNYSLKKGARYETSRHEFVLRKDLESGHWKILGFGVPDETAQ